MAFGILILAFHPFISSFILPTHASPIFRRVGILVTDLLQVAVARVGDWGMVLG
jgi:hypothetical protein